MNDIMDNLAFLFKTHGSYMGCTISNQQT